MQLITEINEDIEYITEAGQDGKKSLYISGPFMMAEVKNKNGRIYPKDVLMKEMNRYNESYVNKKRAFGELGHPDGPGINLERVSHMITELREDGNNVVGKAKIMDTPYGKIVKNLIDEGAKLGVSSRGMGSLKPVQDGLQEVQGDFYLATAADIVADPSAPDAFVSGIMEGKEWVWDNGLLKEKEIVEYQKKVERATEISRNKIRIEAFENFITKL